MADVSMASSTDDPYLQVALQAARQAAEIQMAYRRRAKVSFKASLSDLVTEADHLCEAAIRQTLSAAYPDHGFYGEETGEYRGNGGWRWIVDPIDGTTNYAHGLPLFAVSIALEDPEGLRVGIIYAPALGECFAAVRGRGAYLNGERLVVSASDRLESSLLVTGFAYNLGSGELHNIEEFRSFTLRSRGVRRLGSAALDLAWVAAGRFDGFWEQKLHAWDIAAGVLMVEEAGGRVTDFSGRRCTLQGGEIVATNGRIHEAMLSVLQSTRSGVRPR